MMMQEKQQKVSKTLTYLIDASSHSTVFENYRKSLIQFCERSELRLHFERTKVSLKRQKFHVFENMQLAVEQRYQC